MYIYVFIYKYTYIYVYIRIPIHIYMYTYTERYAVGPLVFRFSEKRRQCDPDWLAAAVQSKSHGHFKA